MRNWTSRLGVMLRDKMCKNELQIKRVGLLIILDKDEAV